jgi:hypothetical protein
MDLSQWHTSCWGIDTQVYDVNLFTKMRKNEEWNRRRAKAANLAHVVNIQMRIIEELLFEMGDIERLEKQVSMSDSPPSSH